MTLILPGLRASTEPGANHVGLYGQRVTAIAALTATAVTRSPQGPQLRLGNTPVTLPHVVARLVVRQLEAPDPWNRLGARRWLFPSPLAAGQHISAKTLSSELNAMGIRAVELRGASLLNLASQLPIKPICDLTGISAQAAGDWADLAARDWNAYPSLRTTGPTATLGGAADLSG